MPYITLLTVPIALVALEIAFASPLAGADHHMTLAAKCDSLTGLSATMLSEDPVKALSLAQDAWALVETDDDRDRQLIALRSMAAAEMRMGLNMEYMRTAMRSVDVATKLGEADEIALALRALSDGYARNMRPEQAVIEARRSLAMLLPLNDQKATMEAHLFLMKTLLKAGKYSEALSAGNPALNNCLSRNDDFCQAKVHRTIAQILLAMDKPADALPYLTKAERVIEALGSHAELFELSIDLARTNMKLGMVRPAGVAMNEAIALLPHVTDPEQKNMLMDLQYEMALEMEQWHTALGHLQKIKARGDSLEKARADMKMAGLQVMHDMKTKDQDNALLRDMNAQQAETIAGQRTSNRYLLILLAGVVVLAVALFITSRYTLRMMRRLSRKNQVIRRQHDEIQGKVLELKRQNLRLAESLMSEEEKELILKEIHHRVKNNLQVVDSLLNIQGNGEDDPRLQRLLKDAQGRIRSMAMVHEHIYRSTGDMHASLRSHFEKLGRSVLVAHGAHDHISINVDTDLPTFPVETMLPLSLVVNELFTNSLKHAFIGMDGGSIRISVKAVEGHYELKYSDDGIGICKLAGSKADHSFGQELISILAHQLNGEFHMEQGMGTVLRLSFTPDKDLLRLAV